MLVRTFTLVGRVLGQSHVDLGLELVTQVAVLEDITVHKSVVFPSKLVQACPPTPSEFNRSVLRVIQTFSRDNQTYLLTPVKTALNELLQNFCKVRTHNGQSKSAW